MSHWKPYILVILHVRGIKYASLKAVIQTFQQPAFTAGALMEAFGNWHLRQNKEKKGNKEVRSVCMCV